MERQNRHGRKRDGLQFDGQLMQDVQATLDGYLDEVTRRSKKDGHLSIKELAFILKTGSRKIRNDIERGRLGIIKMGPEESKCHIRIPTASALGYILQFFTAESDLPPIEESPLFSKIKRL
jgi:hypothetical protein